MSDYPSQESAARIPSIDQSYQSAVAQAHRALQEKDRKEARRWAQLAVSLAPEREEAWLILAALGSPKASLAYLKRALEINPQSQRARQGIHWAVQRQRATQAAVSAPGIVRPRQIITQPIPSDALVKNRPVLLPWALIIVLLAAGLFFWFGSPSFSLAFTSNNKPLPLAQGAVGKETRTPTPTATSTPTSTPTATPTPTNTPTPTDTPTSTPTDTPVPTQKPKNKKTAAPPQFAGRPAGVGPNERWIEVNLSTQRSYAYEGDQLVNSFIVSTGTWLHPTVTGLYHIYVKYRYADMSGPGYYLPNVPYVMYFYKGYGLHGTYWHHNFGTPMSHGCVNMITSEAGWVFNWASVGTAVYIHY